MLVDIIGVPMGFTVSSANIHDAKLLEKKLKDAINHGICNIKKNVHCTLKLDKGYYSYQYEAITFEFWYDVDILSRGEENKEKLVVSYFCIFATTPSGMAVPIGL